MIINEILRNGRTLSIEELSNTVSRRLEEFWPINIDSDNKVNTDSDNEADCNLHDNITDGYDSDEELDLNDDLDIINNVIISKNRGMRLFDNIKREHDHTFFRVIVNNE